jgi:hypothetical protein
VTTARKSPSASKRKSSAGFIESMECLPVSKIPVGPRWTYEIKLDGYRLEVVKAKGKITLYSRRRNVLNRKFGYIAEALEDIPDGTVLDGELVALSAEGHTDFNMLQNFRSAEHQIRYYAFDVLMHKGKSFIGRPLAERRGLDLSLQQGSLTGRSGWLVPDWAIFYYQGTRQGHALHLKIAYKDGSPIGDLTLTHDRDVLKGTGSIHGVAVTLVGRRPQTRSGNAPTLHTFEPQLYYRNFRRQSASASHLPR